jgi:cell division protease FtsH
MSNYYKFTLGYVLVILTSMLLLQTLLPPEVPRISYTTFKRYVHEEKVEQVMISDALIRGTLKPGAVAEGKSRAFTTVPVADPDLIRELEARGVDIQGQYDSPFVKTLLSWVLPVLIVIMVAIWVFASRRMSAGGEVMAFGKSRARIYAQKANRVTFANVAGQDEAKEELQEIIEFLCHPQKFRLLGGKLPRGVLLVGPPGTGKTLLAKAVAGEAGVPFFSISGTEFVELFVGVGAARVRDLFEQAQAKAPCIVFIDELDALGKARGLGGFTGGHDEREHTLNQLLVEMDGFDTSKGVIILAATNRPELLDPALLRPGRFDRQVLVDRPDLRGREAILHVHAQGVTVAPDVDIALLAQRTPGFVGADLANVVNEATVLAARKNKQQVEMRDFEEAIDRVIAGLEKKNRVINPKERQIVAVYETEHALVAACTPGADKVHKISIIPRGIGALGHTQQLPTADRYLMTRHELQGKIDVLFGGRAAEQVVFEEISTGAHDDLQRATEIARAMVLEYGMGDTLGPVTFPRRHPLFLPEHPASPAEGHHEYREATAQALDLETKKILEERLEHVVQLLRDKRPLLDRLAAMLLDKEVIAGEEFERIVHADKPRQAV